MVMISTGGFNQFSLVAAANYLIENGFSEIELSGCKWSEKSFQELSKIDLNKIKLQPHNYFSSKKKPFVLNLASSNKTVIKESIEHCKFAIELSSKFGSKYFSVHAGFLIDPEVSELGKKISIKKINNRSEGKQNFIKNIKELVSFAAKYNVRLLIENNVLNIDNLKQFGENPFLMVTPDECLEVMTELNKTVGLLVDVAHLKVSANSLKYEPSQLLKVCDKFIEAYHLSDNDGKYDENKTITEDSWFWNYLKNDVEYISLEVYTSDIMILKNALQLIERKYGKSKN